MNTPGNLDCAQEVPEVEILRARVLHIVDDAGLVRVSLGVDHNGNPTFEMFGPRGEARLAARLADGAAWLHIGRHDPKDDGSLSVDIVALDSGQLAIEFTQGGLRRWGAYGGPGENVCSVSHQAPDGAEGLV